ncbi:MAG: proline iminopeptidase [Chloroflexota bacterium]|nr:proline iminopeptidase [Chloroflexota bacterium]
MDAGGSLLTIELEQLTNLPGGSFVEWEALGEGVEPLVWVEGGPGLPAHLARADVVPVLDRFRCHLVNAPGSGRTTAPATEAGYDLGQIVEFFEAWRRAVGLGPVTLMGHSWGGLVAPAWAALHPEGVRRLIVIDGYAGAGSVDPALARAEQQRALDRVRDRPWFGDAWGAWEQGMGLVGRPEEALVEAFRAMLPLYFAEPEDPVMAAHIERIRRETRFHAPVVDAWEGEREDADYRPLIARIRCPTLVIVGEHDWICGPVWNRALADAIPGSRLVEFPGVGHLPQYEVPAAFRAAIDAWLGE